MQPGWAHLEPIDADEQAQLPLDRTNFLSDAGSLLDVAYDFDRAHSELGFSRDAKVFGERQASGLGFQANPADTAAKLNTSGVWRFRELMPYWGSLSDIVSVGEGRTLLQRAEQLRDHTGMKGVDLLLQYEGMNPSGSFKDNGMTGAFTHANMVGAKRVVCASTGNTSASLALYAGASGMRGYVLVGSGKIAFGKLSQALDFGARTLQVDGDFDSCLARVRQVSLDRPELGVYLMNSLNPFRLEGQKAVMFRALEALGWQSPDWVVVPGGNLGNSSAFGKAFIELHRMGFLDKVPRLAVINAAGASTLDRVYNDLNVRWEPAEGENKLRGRWDKDKLHAEFKRMDDAGERANTVATAIQINRPVNLPKCLRALHFMDGVVRSVDDDCILEHKAMVGRMGYACEPASAASVAGARQLYNEGLIKDGDRVVCILTGHGLKDPDATVNYHLGHALTDEDGSGAGKGWSVPLGKLANAPVRTPDDLDKIIKAMS